MGSCVTEYAPQPMRANSSKPVMSLLRTENEMMRSIMSNGATGRTGKVDGKRDQGTGQCLIMRRVCLAAAIKPASEGSKRSRNRR